MLKYKSADVLTWSILNYPYMVCLRLFETFVAIGDWLPSPILYTL